MLPNRFITRYDVNTTMKPRRPLNFQEMVGFGQGTGGLLHLVWFRCPVPRIEPTRPRPLLRDKYSGCQICGTQLRPVVKSHDQGTAVPNGIDPFLDVIHAVGSEWVDTHRFSTLKIKHRTVYSLLKVNLAKYVLIPEINSTSSMYSLIQNIALSCSLFNVAIHLSHLSYFTAQEVQHYNNGAIS
ncbi:uncharacterized protein LOC135485080 [Lineus longissimus]|uniref:uncharacterized protein LOC135485080 n=1 Tax=Lineus longissimus TaxID=88925 RepID=UPI00315CD3B4